MANVDRPIVSKMASKAICSAGDKPCNVGLVARVAVEAARFAIEANDAYRKYRGHGISKDGLRRQMSKVASDCAGRVVESTPLGVVGQLVIPVKALGGFIGWTLGNLVVHWCSTTIRR